MKVTDEVGWFSNFILAIISECQYRCYDDKIHGSRCLCPEGYIEVNGRCEDINECENEFIAPSEEICVNLRGSYRNFSISDYILDFCVPEEPNLYSYERSCKTLCLNLKIKIQRTHAI